MEHFKPRRRRPIPTRQAFARVLALLSVLLLTGCRGGASGDGPAPTETGESRGLRLLRARGSILFPLGYFKPELLPYGDGDEVEPDPDTYPLGSLAIVGASDFYFRFEQAGRNIFLGNDVLEVGPTGWAELYYDGYDAAHQGVFRSPFQLSKAELEGLERELTELDVFALPAQFKGGSEDGNYWIMHVRAEGQQKQVAFVYAIPEPLRRLSWFLHETILMPHRGDIERGEKLSSVARRYLKAPFRK